MNLLAFHLDLCHLVLREWIDWRDLSSLDIAYLGCTCRSGWLSQISSLTFTQPPAPSISSDDERLAIFYAWLFSRNVVASERFPVRLRVLMEALPSCPSSYSHAIRSIVIDKRTEHPLTMTDFINQLNALSDFLHGCHHLKSVKIDGKFFLISASQVNDIVIGERFEELLLNTIATCLGKNRLHCLEITSHYAQPQQDNHHPVHRLLVNHVSTLREFQLLDVSRSIIPSDQSDSVLEILSSHPFHLTKLILSTNRKGPTTSQFIDYLTSGAGKTLTELELEYSLSCFQIDDDILESIAMACPNLKGLALLKNLARHDEVRHLSSLFQHCPGLKRVTFAHVSIDIEDTNEIEITSTLKLFNSITFNQRIDWVDCLTLLQSYYPSCSFAIIIYNEATSNEEEFLSYLISKLKDHIVRIKAVMSESILINFVRELSRLEELLILTDNQSHLTDLSLDTIAKYGLCLKELRISGWGATHHVKFTERGICEMARACRSLEVVVLPYEGYEVLFAILELPGLTKFELFSCEESPDADVNEILKKQLVWPSTFSWGVIDAKNCIINFDANRLLHPGVTMKHGH